ncbi:hypothetical protein ACS0TY_009529 [Phlomoides rotata]
MMVDLNHLICREVRLRCPCTALVQPREQQMTTTTITGITVEQIAITIAWKL